jgi:hypothetical protein
MLRRVALVRTDVSEELSASFIRVTRIGELGTSNIPEDTILHVSVWPTERKSCMSSRKSYNLCYCLVRSLFRKDTDQIHLNACVRLCLVTRVKRKSLEIWEFRGTPTIVCLVHNSVHPHSLGASENRMLKAVISSRFEISGSHHGHY